MAISGSKVESKTLGYLFNIHGLHPDQPISSPRPPSFQALHSPSERPSHLLSNERLEKTSSDPDKAPSLFSTDLIFSW